MLGAGIPSHSTEVDKPNASLPEMPHGVVPPDIMCTGDAKALNTTNVGLDIPELRANP